MHHVAERAHPRRPGLPELQLAGERPRGDVDHRQARVRPDEPVEPGARRGADDVGDRPRPAVEAPADGLLVVGGGEVDPVGRPHGPQRQHAVGEHPARRYAVAQRSRGQRGERGRDALARIGGQPGEARDVGRAAVSGPSLSRQPSRPVPSKAKPRGERGSGGGQVAHVAQELDAPDARRRRPSRPAAAPPRPRTRARARPGRSSTRRTAGRRGPDRRRRRHARCSARPRPTRGPCRRPGPGAGGDDVRGVLAGVGPRDPQELLHRRVLQHLEYRSASSAPQPRSSRRCRSGSARRARHLGTGPRDHPARAGNPAAGCERTGGGPGPVRWPRGSSQDSARR